ncbi:MAG TPA: hypothetical protein VHN15_00725, partial [Thermoanaerobaculia bacterium]|nr:hypothetical protein [Thermoanaerobaculia bacterium]
MPYLSQLQQLPHVRIRRPLRQLPRRPELQDPPAAQHRHPVRQPKRLGKTTLLVTHDLGEA